MQSISWRRLLLMATTSMFIIHVIGLVKMISDPVERSGLDFIAFYAAGRVAQEHGIAAVYDIEYQQEVEQEVVGFPLVDGQVLLYNHMPYLVPLLVLVVNGHYVGSFLRWVLILIGVYVIGTHFLVKSLFVAERPELRFAWLAGSLTFFPLFVSLWQGQDTAFLYLGIVCWCAGILKKQDWLVGIGIALATIRPHISITLALPLLFRYQKAWWRSMFLVGMLAFTSLAILGVEGTSDFVKLLLISSEGTWFGMKPEAMLNLLGFIMRIVQLPSSSTVSLVGWLIYLTSLVLVCDLWRRSEIIDLNLLGLSILIAVVFAPHLHLHDLTLLIFPLLFVSRERVVSLSEPYWTMVPILMSLLLMISLLSNLIYFTLPYAVFTVLARLLVYPGRNF